MREPITEVIQSLTQQYLDKTPGLTLEGINRGECETFAQAVIARVYGGNMFGVEEFQQPDGKFDWHHLEAEWGISPPGGFTHEQVDAADLGGHLWIVQRTVTFGGVTTNRHYDCECPEGVDSFFDLPFFKRQLTKRVPDHGLHTS